VTAVLSGPFEAERIAQGSLRTSAGSGSLQAVILNRAAAKDLAKQIEHLTNPAASRKP